MTKYTLVPVKQISEQICLQDAMNIWGRQSCEDYQNISEMVTVSDILYMREGQPLRECVDTRDFYAAYRFTP